MFLVFFSKKTTIQEARRPSPEGVALFAEIMAFEKKDQKPSADGRPEVQDKMESIAVETKQSPSETSPRSPTGFMIHYEKTGENFEAFYLSPTFAVAKSRILLNSGFSVYLVDSDGRRFSSDEFDRILAFKNPHQVAVDTPLSLAESRIDAVLDVLKSILTDPPARALPPR